MSFFPQLVDPDPPVFLGPYSFDGVGAMRAAESLAVPASGVYSQAQRAIFYPLTVRKSYTLQRFWWLNGATVGTDSVMAALYRDVAGAETIVASTAYTLSAGTANACQYATPAVQAHVVTSGNDTTDGTSYTTASVTLYARPGIMYALAFANSKASAAQAASAVTTTSGGVTFSSRNSQTYGASTEGRVSIWTAVPTSDVTDTVKIDFGGGNTQTGCTWALIAFSNVNTSTNHGFVQTVVGSGNSTTPLATLAAFGSANNATFMAQGNLSSAQTTGTNFRELTDTTYATPSNFLGTNFYSGNDTTADATITSGQWGAVAAEIKSLGTTVTVPAGRYWYAIWCSGTTATFFRTASSTAFVPAYFQNSLTTGLPVSATMAAVGALTGQTIVCGITSRSSP